MIKKGEPLTKEQRSQRIKDGVKPYWEDKERSKAHRDKISESMLKFWNEKITRIINENNKRKD
jgi:hypothetical protein